MQRGDTTQPTSAPFTVGDLLAEADLGLTVTPDEQVVRTRPLVGAHVVEIPHPASWVERDWLVLTTGVWLKADPSAIDDFVAELTAAGAAALAFGLEPTFEQVPRRLLKAAEKQGIPLITVPVRTPFSDVVARVFRASLSGYVRASVRLLAMQRYLSEAMGEESPEQQIIERLSKLIDGDAALFTPDGQAERTVGGLPADLIWSEITRRQGRTMEFEISDRLWFAQAVTGPESAIRRWLVVSAGPGASTDLMKAAAHVAVPILTAVGRLERSQRHQRRLSSNHALRTLLSGADRAESSIESVGFTDRTRGAIFVVAFDALAGEDALSLVERAVDETGIATAIDLRAGRVVLAVGADDAGLRRLAQRIATLVPSAVVAIGSTTTLVGGAVRSYAEAELSADRSLDMGLTGVQYFSDADRITAILGQIPAESIAIHARPLLAAVGDSPVALETLKTYFDCNLSVPTAAARLHLHRNSLRYRLAQIEAKLGGSLRDPGVITAVYCAMRAVALDEQPEEVLAIAQEDQDSF